MGTDSQNREREREKLRQLKAHSKPRFPAPSSMEAFTTAKEEGCRKPMLGVNQSKACQKKGGGKGGGWGGGEKTWAGPKLAAYIIKNKNT